MKLKPSEEKVIIFFIPFTSTLDYIDKLKHSFASR